MGLRGFSPSLDLLLQNPSPAPLLSVLLRRTRIHSSVNLKINIDRGTANPLFIDADCWLPSLFLSCPLIHICDSLRLSPFILQIHTYIHQDLYSLSLSLYQTPGLQVGIRDCQWGFGHVVSSTSSIIPSFLLWYILSLHSLYFFSFSRHIY